MKKYKVEITQTETYVVDVEAKNEREARAKAKIKWSDICDSGTYHYHETGDTTTEFSNIYNVTGTDDPFDP